LERFARNKNTISIQQQEILANKKVLVIGSGGLGSHVIEGLTRIGIENIGVCDFDIIEESNLNRQLLALEDSIGHNKAMLAKERILMINKNVIVNVYVNKYPNQTIINDLKYYDLIIDCLDSIEMRKQLEKDVLAVNKELIYGSIAGSYGYFGLINKNNQLMINQLLQGQSIEKILGNPYYTVASLAALQLKLAIDYLLDKEIFQKGFYVLDLIDFTIDKIEIE
jgi:molybdopterin/thiamine biosynthesis adenylyltransferase